MDHTGLTTVKIQVQKLGRPGSSFFIFPVAVDLESLQIIQNQILKIQKRNPNGQYIQGVNGECAADLVINADADTDKLILNVNSNRGYRYTRTQECNNPCCMQWSEWTKNDCRNV